MRRRRHGLPHINTSSMTDLAFTLLFFFLVAATIDADSGLLRLLPPSETTKQNKQTPKIKQRNVFIIEIRSNNSILANGAEIRLTELREKCMQFINNTENNPQFAEKQFQSINLIGNCMRSKAIVYLKIDRQARYQSYIDVQSEISAAYIQMRENAAAHYFNKPIEKLSKIQLDAIKALIPQRITETEL